jgi:hypothetical protein
VKLKQDTIPTGTDGTFTVEGVAPPEQEASLQVKALFADDDPLYQGSESDAVTYPKGNTPPPIIATSTSKIATKLVLHEITEVDPGDSIKVEGILTSSPDNVGLADKSITFSTSGTVKLKQDTIPTGTDGTFTVEGVAPPEQEASFQVKALFADDDPLYQGSESNAVTFPKESISAVLELDPIAGVDPTAHVPVKGTLSSSDSHEGLAQKPIRLTLTRTSGTSGPIESCDLEVRSSVIPNPASAPTEPESGVYAARTGSDGKFVSDDIGPLCKEGLWEIQAHYDGDSDYAPTSDAEGFSTSDDVVVLKVEDIIYQQRADKKEVGIELPIPDPSDLPKDCELLTDEDHNDKLNEVDIRGTTLNFDSKDKIGSKIIEYSIFYDCKKSKSALEQMKELVGEATGSMMLSNNDNDPIILFAKPDIIPPGAPVITSPTSSVYSGDYDEVDHAATGTFLFKVVGTAEPDSSVTIFSGSDSLGTAHVEGGGGWTLPGVTLPIGKYTLTAKAKDVAGNTGPPSAPIELEIVCPNNLHWSGSYCYGLN